MSITRYAHICLSDPPSHLTIDYLTPCCPTPSLHLCITHRRMAITRLLLPLSTFVTSVFWVLLFVLVFFSCFLYFFVAFFRGIKSPCSIAANLLGGDYSFRLLFAYLFLMVWPLVSDPDQTFCGAGSDLFAKILVSLPFPKLFVLPLIATLCGCIGSLYGSCYLFDLFPLVSLLLCSHCLVSASFSGWS